MKPFLLLSARPEVEAVRPEYESVRRAMGLDASRLEHLRLDVDPLGDVSPERFAGIVVGGSPYNVTTPDTGKHAVSKPSATAVGRLCRWRHCQAVRGSLRDRACRDRHRRR